MIFNQICCHTELGFPDSHLLSKIAAEKRPKQKAFEFIVERSGYLKTYSCFDCNIKNPAAKTIDAIPSMRNTTFINCARLRFLHLFTKSSASLTLGNGVG